MPMPIPSPSTVTIRMVEKLRHIAPDRLFKRREGGTVARATQILHLALREVLVLVANRQGHVDIFDVGLAAEGPEHGLDQVAEAARTASADIEDARHGGAIDQP